MVCLDVVKAVAVLVEKDIISLGVVCLDIVKISEVVHAEEMTADNEVCENNNIIKSCECNVLNDITFIYYINNTIIKYELTSL